MTSHHHRADPRADVELVEGVFSGCCHAGVGDVLCVPRSGEGGRFSPALIRALEEARGPRLHLGPPREYVVRERPTGRVVRGVACLHLGPAGCRLGDLKAPLCVVYLCDPVRAVLAGVVGWGWVGPDSDDFGGSLETLRAVVAEPVRAAEERVARLEESLAGFRRAMESRGFRSGEDLYGAWKLAGG